VRGHSGEVMRIALVGQKIRVFGEVPFGTKELFRDPATVPLDAQSRNKTKGYFARQQASPLGASHFSSSTRRVNS